MSTFVLKREYALQLPTCFVDVDKDEMEYVDGGGPSFDAIMGGVIGSVIGALAAGFGFVIKRSLVGVAVSQLGGWAIATVNSVFLWAWANPWAASGVLGGIALSAGIYAKKMGWTY